MAASDVLKEAARPLYINSRCKESRMNERIAKLTSLKNINAAMTTCMWWLPWRLLS